METKNEMMINENVCYETGEVRTLNQFEETEIVVQENADYKIVKLSDGTFKKNMKYKQYFSRVAENEEEQIELYKVFNDKEAGLVTPLSNMKDKEIIIDHVFIQPYESFDETTGNVTNGVTVTLQDTDGEYYATSSKSVYYTILNIMQVFGRPSDENYKPIKVKVTGTKRVNGVQIDLQLIGRV